MIDIKVMQEYFHPRPNSAGLYFVREPGWSWDAGLDVAFALKDSGHGDTLACLVRPEVDFGIFPTNRFLPEEAMS